MPDAYAPGEGQIHYAQYLQLETLLAAQQPVTDHPDELHFIIVHQVHELWFRLALHHLARTRAAMQADALPEAVRLINQVIEIYDNLNAAIRQLHSLPPAAFHHYRRFLAPGSGLQSYQFRALEFMCGLRDARHVAWVRRALATEAQWDEVRQQLDAPSLADTLDTVLARHDRDPADVYGDMDAHPALYALCDALAMLDHRVLSWRMTHIQLVERTIGGATVGTGGTTHDYLTATLHTRFFPRLWAARNTLSDRFDAASPES